MSGAPATVPLLRLLQVTDSAFPAGGFAFSHGLEWLVDRRAVTGEEDVAAVVRAYVSGPGAGQLLPAALRAHRSRSEVATIRADDAFDLSLAAPAERMASVAMGERLLAAAADALDGEAAGSYLAAVHHGHARGHYPIAFGLVARDNGIDERSALAALGFTMATSMTQAAIRLGVIGQSAGVRLTADAAGLVDLAVSAALRTAGRRFVGSFLPGLEVASMLQPRLAFRMFGS